MPQPLRRWPDDLAWTANAGALRPKLAPWIVRVSAEWAKVQIHLGLVLAATLDAEAHAGVHMYLALTGSAAQEAALSAAVNTQLPEAYQSAFVDILRKYRACARQRNRIVHCLWGVSLKYPNGLINCPPENIILGAISKSAPRDDVLEKCMVYTEKDFFELCDAIQALGIDAYSFVIKASLFHHPTQFSSESERLQVLQTFFPATKPVHQNARNSRLKGSGS
ncbi:hypothetical protein LHFGNBLO_004699 [Mesorhizobium sp. AR10]|uniref:hypothetical protein n=1 Tax=Mesorhizobium sp. AR10 TaxID=2865839 RepID=UPI00215F9D0F|nr:hypothetical protein [Mesorhizobium sp. AR10]UVK37634.1 hypothetical protein LHFGNBLO_004699 [Mesorhizobium sp. AR10]